MISAAILVVCASLMASASFVILSKDSVYAALSLISAFASGSGILFLLENEFFALMFLVIYLGAVAILFLFVVMMLNLKYLELQTNELHFPLAILLGVFLFTETSVAYSKFFSENSFQNEQLVEYSDFFEDLDTLTDLEVLSQFFYTHHVFQILVAGVILYIAVIGVALLTIKTASEKHAKRSQNVTRQVSRNPVLR